MIIFTSKKKKRKNYISKFLKNHIFHKYTLLYRISEKREGRIEKEIKKLIVPEISD